MPDQATPDHKTGNATGWVYTGVWQVLTRWFRVPETPPTLPTTPGDEPDAFKPARGYLSYMKISLAIVLAALDLAALITWFVITVQAWWAGLLLAVPALILIAVINTLAYLAIHLRYDTTWYVMSERSLRIRRGIWVIHEMTFTFENVQNVRVQQGPLQRMFGISDLIVETAGAGADSSGKHEAMAMNQGRIEGVEDAWQLRDRVLKILKNSRAAGIGDDRRLEERPGPTGNPLPHGVAWSPEHIQTLRAIRDELRGMRGPANLA